MIVTEKLNEGYGQSLSFQHGWLVAICFLKKAFYNIADKICRAK